jgi:hypothetical protein
MKSVLFGFDARDERANLLGHEMIDLDRYAAPSGLLHKRRGFLDRLRPVHLRSLCAGRPPGNVDGRSGRPQLYGYPASRSSGRSSDQGNLACERVSHGTLGCVMTEAHT